MSGNLFGQTMKCLLIQTNGAHQGQDGWTRNDYLRECFAFQHAFQENGHIADVWGKRHSNFEQIPDYQSYDVILFMEQYEMEWTPNMSDIKGPLKIQWIVDLHCQSANAYLPISEGVDIILHSTKSLMSDYQSKIPNRRHLWFPSGVDNRYFDKNKHSYTKNTDVAFVGSKNPSRIEFIEKLEQSVGLKYQFATGTDMFKAISETKIHFNKNISCDLNYRHFETIGLGTCLLTDYQPDLEELGFKDDNNCLWYKDFEECERKIKSTIENGKWIEIGNKGYELSKENSYTQRLKNILAI